MAEQFSKDAEQFIIVEEVGGKATYEKRYQRPEWPGGASGVTVGVGYDLGYANHLKIDADWTQRIAGPMVRAMHDCAGVRGDEARSRLPVARSSIVVPWDVAYAVFERTDIPHWSAQVRNILPNCDKLHPDSFGALVSLAYNRGLSFNTNGERYREMRAIKAHMAAQNFERIPGEIRAMKRLWNNGLVNRREREAKLFERGLAAQRNPARKPPPVITVNDENRAAATKTAAGASVGAGVAGGAGGSANKTYGWELAAGALALALALGVIVYVWRARHRKMPKADPVLLAG